MLLEDKPDTTTAMTATNTHKKAAETVSFSSQVSLYLLLHFNARWPRQPLPISVFMLASPLPVQ